MSEELERHISILSERISLHSDELAVHWKAIEKLIQRADAAAHDLNTHRGLITINDCNITELQMEGDEA